MYPGGKKGKFNKNDTNHPASFLEDVSEMKNIEKHNDDRKGNWFKYD